MYKPTLLIVFLCGMSIIEGAPIQESSDVRKSMHDAFQNSLEVFGGKVDKNANIVVPDAPNPSKPKVFSAYTQGLSALGGGKPNLTSQYMFHKYTPLAPVVNPPERKPQVSDKMSPSEAADRYRPQAPHQYTTDRLFHWAE